jgi:hypothetical protein
VIEEEFDAALMVFPPSRYPHMALDACRRDSPKREAVTCLRLVSGMDPPIFASRPSEGQP